MNDLSNMDIEEGFDAGEWNNMPRKSTRLTQRELRAIQEALSARLAGEYDIDTEEAGFSKEDADSAQEKIAERIK